MRQPGTPDPLQWSRGYLGASGRPTRPVWRLITPSHTCATLAGGSGDAAKRTGVGRVRRRVETGGAAYRRQGPRPFHSRADPGPPTVRGRGHGDRGPAASQPCEDVFADPGSLSGAAMGAEASLTVSRRERHAPGVCAHTRATSHPPSDACRKRSRAGASPQGANGCGEGAPACENGRGRLRRQGPRPFSRRARPGPPTVCVRRPSDRGPAAFATGAVRACLCSPGATVARGSTTPRAPSQGASAGVFEVAVSGFRSPHTARVRA